jgi:hypothetical protein
MSETAGRTSTRIDPETAWTVVTDSPLKGLSLAREAGAILAWDEGNQLYLFDTRGDSLSYSRVPSPILAGAISDDGGLIALLVDAEDAGLLLLDADFSVEQQKPAPSEASFVTIDPHGRYLAVGTRHGLVHLINRYGRPAGRLETVETISHFCFVPDRPIAIVAAAFGMMAGVALDPTRGGDRLETEILWQERMMSTVGRLALSGDGAMVLASCYTLGIQRFDLRGRNEGSYHLGGTVSHAIPDFPGRTIAAATLERELALMNSAGNVRWRTTLPRPITALEMDPLGRFVVYGHATGEIVRLDLFGGAPGRTSARTARRAATAQSSGSAVRSSTGGVRTPNWVVPAVDSDQQAETAVLAVSEDPPLIALFTSPQRVQLFDMTGQKRGEASDLAGVGRLLRTSPGWLAAATDRQIILFDLKHQTHRRLDVSLMELTHLAIRPDEFGLALVQERDRIGRLTVSNRWVWKQELRSPIEDIAIGPYGFVAVTTHGGELIVFDPAGESTSGFTFDPTDPPLLIEAPVDSPPPVAWITLARRAQSLRGHDLRGQVLWERPLPWEGWAFYRLHKAVVATAADGSALACAGSGEMTPQSTSSGEANDVFFTDPSGVPLRLTRRGVHLICSSLDGRVRWRAFLDGLPGPLGCATPGVAVMIGRSLAWFQDESPPP